MPPLNILLFGRKGQLGWELQRTLSATDNQIHAFSSNELNVSDLQKLQKRIEEIQPHLIINASAYTAVDLAEREPELARRVNAEAPAVMATVAKRLNAAFIHYSTDYVFDGTKHTPYNENDITNPLNVYGKSKLNGEQAICQVGGAFIILRTSWLYSLLGSNFVTKVLSWARQKKTLQIVTDQIGSPTWARMLAELTFAVLVRGLPESYDYFIEKSGIYNLGGSGSVSRYEFAQTILRLDPRAEDQIVQQINPALTTDFPTPARRPLATPLDCSRFERVFGLRLPNWEESLRLALKE